MRKSHHKQSALLIWLLVRAYFIKVRVTGGLRHCGGGRGAGGGAGAFYPSLLPPACTPSQPPPPPPPAPSSLTTLHSDPLSRTIVG